MGAAVDSKYLTLGEFGEHIAEAVGLDLSDIKADGLRVTAELGRMDGPLFLEVTTYCRNEKGHRYLDDGGKDPATEVRRFPIAALKLRASL